MRSIVEFKNIFKSYPGVIANDDVSFNIKEQSIHAILGENGAEVNISKNFIWSCKT